MLITPPTIGITLSTTAEAKSPATTGVYVQALAAHGADLVTLTADSPPANLAALDGLLLPGGVDVDPDWYGEARHPQLGKVDAARDHLEIPLTRQALARGLPVLGICRGAQVLGVALGGKLHQDIPSCVPGALRHSPSGEVKAEHRVRVAPGSRLREVLGEDAVLTNSYHHQANSALGPTARAVAWSEDGIVEAIEAGTGFVLGLQWHPERMLDDARQVRLFAAFVSAARGYQLEGLRSEI